MKKKFLYSLFALFLINTMFIGCKRDLTVVPNSLQTADDVFTDKNLITAVLARFYSQVNQVTNPPGNPPNFTPGGAAWGASNATDDSFQQDPDDAVNNRGGASAQQVAFTKDRYRAFDYGLIRRINQFLIGIRSEAAKKAMTPFENASFEGQAMFLRAWTFFHMVKTLGGLTIVGDEVFEFAGGTDATPLQKPRDSEEKCYDYILDQCDKAAAKLTNGGIATIPAGQNANAALANRWACKMLKARAALTAASIAKWNNGNVNLNKTDKLGVQTHGIPAAKADAYYKAAFDAAKEVIDGGAYSIMKGTDLASAQQAFQNAINIKAGNTEVIWTADRLLPNVNTTWTRVVGPVTHTEEALGNQLGAGAEFVESFEDRATRAQGIKTRTGTGDAVGVTGPVTSGAGLIGTTPIMYDLSNPADNPFMQKDARLYASVIWPQAPFKGIPVDLRAGEWRGEYNSDGTLKVYTSAPAPKGTAGTFLTSINGPAENTSQIVNKTGFIPRKWLDEKPGASLGPNYSDMWVIRFRLAEAYSICAEAALLSAPLGGAAVGVNYINVLRSRGLLQPLSAGQFDFEQLRKELRVEFYMEDHRLWDMNRWRLADSFWDGVTCGKCSLYPNGTSFPWQLYGYTVNIAGNPGGNNGKYVFERKRAFRKRANPNYFESSSYYSTMDNAWLTYNPNWERNPGQ
nr:RagB/SusD family nutrient uptake outer membrane protein [uncultured Mucilaginibacter sp.]